MTNDPTPMPGKVKEFDTGVEAVLWADVPSLDEHSRKQVAKKLLTVFRMAEKDRDKKMLRDLATGCVDLWLQDDISGAEDTFVTFDHVKDVLKRHKV